MAGEYLNDEAMDQGLDWVILEGTRIDVTSQVATTYTEAITTYSLGNKASLTVGATQDGTVSGRKVVVPAITDGTVSATGTATHWALTDATDTLVATGPLSASVGVTSGKTFTLDAIEIEIPDAV